MYIITMNIITNINKIRNSLFQSDKLETRVKKIRNERALKVKQYRETHANDDGVSISDEYYIKQTLLTNDDLVKSHNTILMSLDKPSMPGHKLWTKTALDKDIAFSKTGVFTIPELGRSLQKAVLHIKVASFTITSGKTTANKCRYVKFAQNRILNNVKVFLAGKLVQNYIPELYNLLAFNRDSNYIAITNINHVSSTVEVYNNVTETNTKLLYNIETNKYEIFNSSHDEHDIYIPIVLGNNKTPIPLTHNKQGIKIEFTICDQSDILVYSNKKIKTHKPINIIECNLYSQHCYCPDKIWKLVFARWPLTTIRSYKSYFEFIEDGTQEQTYTFNDVTGLISSVNIAIRPVKNKDLADYWFKNNNITFTEQKMLIGSVDTTTSSINNELLWYHAQIPNYSKIIQTLCIKIDGEIINYDMDASFISGYLNTSEKNMEFGHWYSYKNLEYLDDKTLLTQKKDLTIDFTISNEEEKYVLMVIVEKIYAYSCES